MTITRIAFAITELDVGGAERALVQLVLGLPRDRWSVHVYCLGPWAPLATTLQDAGVGVTCLNAIHVWDAPRVVWSLRQKLRKFQPAILQTFLFHANILGRLAGAWAGVPKIVSGIRVAERRSPIYGWVDRTTNFLVARNVCVSQGVAAFCEEEIGLNPRKTVVIPNGVELDRFRRAIPIDRQHWASSPRDRLILAIARLDRQKGLDVLLQAMDVVFPEYPDAVLAILGEGPEQAALERQAERWIASKRVRFLGRRDDVPRWLRAAEIFVLASRWEGMPNALLEAMAAGLPVVATSVEGVTDVVTPGESGLLVPPESAAAISDALRRLLAEPETRQKLGYNAQLTIQESFTSDSIARRYAAFYEDLLAEPAAAPTAPHALKNS